MNVTNLENNICEPITYEDLSSEFKSLYPTVVKAYQLIPRMYNRLTLYEKKTHKEAMQKMYEDDNHLTEFSTRNMRRHLPSDNLNIPHSNEGKPE
jgi:hypothetical protein